MRNIFIFIMASVFLSTVNAQDIIIKKDGESIVSKIYEIGLNEIKFKKINNLEGPLYIVSKKEVYKIIFSNGTEEIIDKKTKTVSLEETKATIIDIIDKYAYERYDDYKLVAKFEQNYLKIRYARKSEPKKYIRDNIYDFSDVCIFHKLSNRNSGISYLNVEVHLIHKRKNGEYKKKFSRKLVILIKNQDKAKILRDALISYNEFFMDKR